MEEESKDTLGDRMKAYEAETTERRLALGLPLYARIDGRAFHTLCRGLSKPFDAAFSVAMRETCRHLVQETGAGVGYVQSDEISLGWTEALKAPFEGRLFKLESVMASMAGAAFMKTAVNDSGNGASATYLRKRVLDRVPSFDCRVMSLPSVAELVNMFIWRQNDCVKNAVSSVARSMYSHRDMHGKDQADQLEMIRMKGYDFEEWPEEDRIGAFFRRVKVLKPVDPEIASMIKLEDRHVNADGEVCVLRTEVVGVDVGRLSLLEAGRREEALFGDMKTEEDK